MTTTQFTSEREFQAAVTKVAKLGGWLQMHIHDSRKSSGVGWPDLAFVHPVTGRLLLVELKMPKGKLSAAQVQWLKALSLQHDAVVWRPEQWADGTIQRELLAERTAAA